MIALSNDDSLMLHPRLVGRPLRACGLVVAAAALVWVTVFAIVRGSPAGATSWWIALSAASVTAAVGAAALGIDELRRPVRFGLDGRARRAALENAALRWHPKVAEVVDECRRTTRVYPGPGGTISSAVREELAGKVVEHLSFEDAPFRVGATARMRYIAKPTRDAAHAIRPRFHLCCVRETPRAASLFGSKIERLVDLIPKHSTRELGELSAAYSLEFDIPAGLPGSNLLAPRPAYWELTVAIDGLAFPYRGRFFVPVADS